MRSFRSLPTLLFSVLLVLGICSVAMSQTVSTRVTGTVKDSAGATVPGAKVTLIDTSTKDQKTATTNEDGSFSIADVRVGTYMSPLKRPASKSFR